MKKTWIDRAAYAFIGGLMCGLLGLLIGYFAGYVWIEVLPLFRHSNRPYPGLAWVFIGPIGVGLIGGALLGAVFTDDAVDRITSIWSQVISGYRKTDIYH